MKVVRIHNMPKTENPIDAILFDMGGTLRRNHKRDYAEKTAIVQGIVDLLDLEITPGELTRLLESREMSYENWAAENLVELDENEIWMKWMLPDMPASKIEPHVMQLNEIWREAIASRVLFPETRETILRLHDRGYRIGLVSNTTSSVDSPQSLKEEGLSTYFDAIVLSCVLGKRKPGAEILIHAAESMKANPGCCAYIGDRPEVDVVAARKAGFKVAVILENPYRPLPAALPREEIPDYFIKNLLELLDIFPDRNRLVITSGKE